MEGWTRTARPDDPNKYFMVSADCHVTESLQFLEGVDDRYRDRVPHFEVRDDGAEFLITEGNRPQLVKPPKGTTVQAQQSFERPEDNRESKSRMEDEDLLRVAGGRTVEQRLADQAADGVDVEIVFPTAGLLCWATPDPVFAMAMCAAWNRWVLDQMGAYMGGSQPKILPMALIAAGDQEGAMRGDRVGRGARLPGRVPRQLADLRAHRARQAAVQRPVVRAHVVAARGDRAGHHVPRVHRQATRGRRAATAAPSSTTCATRWRPPSSRWCS